VTDLRTEGERRVDDLQLELLRRAGTARRHEIANALSSRTIALSREALRRRHPEWNAHEVRIAWAAIHYGEEIARRIADRLSVRG
jgi:hypothetical protein